MPDTSESGVSYGVCKDFDQQMQTFDYCIGVDDTGQDSLESFQIPATTWAIFTSVGALPDAIQDVTKRAYNDWFPTSNFEHAGTPELEVYLPGDPSQADYRCEVWVPVIEKS
jgi:AraC family transcriptional regulator